MPAKKKRALGRGLDALLGADPPAIAQRRLPATGLQTLSVGLLRPNPFQPRRRLEEEGLEELTASIRESGILQPLVVRPAGRAFEIVAGERRWRAAQQAGLAEVPALVRQIDDQQMLELALVENLQREALGPVEEARAYQRLVDEFGHTQDQVAQRVGKSRVTVTNSLRLLKLPAPILEWLEAGQLSAGHARAILGLTNESAQLALARDIMRLGLSVREAERRVRRLARQRDGKTRPAQSPADGRQQRDLEERLTIHLGLRVRLQARSNGAGHLEVYWSNLEEFQTLIEKLGLSIEQDI
jgi:ParB family chromosome partitioning protein